MPYIESASRDLIDENMKRLMNMNLDVGDLNYIITQLFLKYIENNNLRYSTCNALVGVLDCCKMEFYRRLVSKYEDKKIKENGDVYDEPI